VAKFKESIEYKIGDSVCVIKKGYFSDIVAIEESHAKNRRNVYITKDGSRSWSNEIELIEKKFKIGDRVRIIEGFSNVPKGAEGVVTYIKEAYHVTIEVLMDNPDHYAVDCPTKDTWGVGEYDIELVEPKVESTIESQYPQITRTESFTLSLNDYRVVNLTRSEAKQLHKKLGELL